MGTIRYSATITPEINMAPMIDVLLVLFIIYLYILSQAREDMRVVVPKPLPPSNRAALPAIVLELPDAGGFRVNGQAVSDQVLDLTLHEIFDQRPVKALFVDPGPDRSYEEVVTAMDRARGAGVLVLSLMPKR